MLFSFFTICHQNFYINSDTPVKKDYSPSCTWKGRRNPKKLREENWQLRNGNEEIKDIVWVVGAGHEHSQHEQVNPLA